MKLYLRALATPELLHRELPSAALFAKLGAARTVPSQIEAQKLLNTLAVDQFAIPGDAGFPLNAHYAPPAGRSDAGAWSEPFG